MDRTQRTLDGIMKYIEENDTSIDFKNELLHFIDSINTRKINMFDVIRRKHPIPPKIEVIVREAYLKAVSNEPKKRR